MANSAASNVSASQPSAYFDLHAIGCGYLSRIRSVAVKKGPKYLCCTINAAHGAKDAVNYTKFDLIVVAQAVEDVLALQAAVDAEQKVWVGFRLGDFHPETFTYEKGKRQGETGVVLKGRLFRLNYAKVNGQAFTLPTKAREAALQAAATVAAASGDRDGCVEHRQSDDRDFEDGDFDQCFAESAKH